MGYFGKATHDRGAELSIY